MGPSSCRKFLIWDVPGLAPGQGPIITVINGQWPDLSCNPRDNAREVRHPVRLCFTKSGEIDFFIPTGKNRPGHTTGSTSCIGNPPFAGSAGMAFCIVRLTCARVKRAGR